MNSDEAVHRPMYLGQRPVCVKCRCEMRPKKNDFCVEEMADTEQPYRVWLADLWHCLSCGAEIVIGFARKPIAEHYQAGYAENRKEAELQFWPSPDMVPAKVAN